MTSFRCLWFAQTHHILYLKMTTPHCNAQPASCCNKSKPTSQLISTKNNMSAKIVRDSYAIEPNLANKLTFLWNQKWCTDLSDLMFYGMIRLLQRNAYRNKQSKFNDPWRKQSMDIHVGHIVAWILHNWQILIRDKGRTGFRNLQGPPLLISINFSPTIGK